MEEQVTEVEQEVITVNSRLADTPIIWTAPIAREK